VTVVCGHCGATMIVCDACAIRHAYAYRCPRGCERPAPSVDPRPYCHDCRDRLQAAQVPGWFASLRTVHGLRDTRARRAA